MDTHDHAAQGAQLQLMIATVRDNIKGLKGALEDADDHITMHEANIAHHQRELEKQLRNKESLTNDLINFKQWLLAQGINPEDE